MALSGATMPGLSGPEGDGNKGVLRIPPSSSITGTSLSDCLVSYQDTSWGGVLPLCRVAVGVFYSPSQLNNYWQWYCYNFLMNKTIHLCLKT